MFSRYDYFSPSVVSDPQDLEPWPDPLSINWGNFSVNSAPSYIRLTETDIDRLWLQCKLLYDATEYDDIVLILNNVPYRKYLNPGDILFFPSKQNIHSFLELSKEVGII